ncbi:MAG: DUF2809 domain-containing protein [Phycisphaerales bacterium]
MATALFCALCVALGLAARTWLDGWPAKYLGVMLWCWVVYGVVLFVAPRLRPLAAGTGALGFSWAVEFAQLTPVPGYLSRQSIWLRWVFGETFSVWDLLGAAVAVVAITVLHTAALTARDRPATLGP